LNYEEEGAIGAGDLNFYGIIEDLVPYLSRAGYFTRLMLRHHHGRALNDMLVALDYGTQSRYPTLDTVKEILIDANEGILPEFVNDILNTGVSSGYNLNTSYIEDVDNSVIITYLYNTYKPAKRVIEDLLDLFQAGRGLTGTEQNKGAHWIVKTEETAGPTFTNYFLLCMLNAHPSSPIDVASKWPLWWNTDQANSTLVEGAPGSGDFSTVNVEKKHQEANYIVYHGKLLKPADEIWTENRSTDWGKDAGVTLTDESTVTKVGSYSVRAESTQNGGSEEFWYPSAQNMSIDANKIGGRYNIPTLNFWVRKNSEVGNSRLYVYLNGIQYDYQFGNLTADKWIGYNVTIGQYNKEEDWANIPASNWADLDAISFQFDCAANANAKYFYVDGLQIDGYVLRGAKKAGESYYKMKIITDDLGKDDSLKATDDSYTMASLAYAELLRSSRTPTILNVAIPGKPSILAGQKAHIHALKYSGGYRINQDMRILKHRLTFNMGGMMSYLTLTDDLYNSNPMRPSNAFNLLKRATNPEFQTRQMGSIKTRNIDITGAILEKTYTFDTAFDVIT